MGYPVNIVSEIFTRGCFRHEPVNFRRQNRHVKKDFIVFRLFANKHWNPYRMLTTFTNNLIQPNHIVSYSYFNSRPSRIYLL